MQPFASHARSRTGRSPVAATHLVAGRRFPYSEPMGWRPGKPPTVEGYEIYDELCMPGGRVVAVMECFAISPTVYYCSAVTPAGKHVRRSFAGNYDTTRDWADATGLKIDRDLSGRDGRLRSR